MLLCQHNNDTGLVIEQLRKGIQHSNFWIRILFKASAHARAHHVQKSLNQNIHTRHEQKHVIINEFLSLLVFMLLASVHPPRRETSRDRIDLLLRVWIMSRVNVLNQWLCVIAHSGQPVHGVLQWFIGLMRWMIFRFRNYCLNKPVRNVAITSPVLLCCCA